MRLIEHAGFLAVIALTLYGAATVGDISADAYYIAAAVAWAAYMVCTQLNK